MPVTFHNLPWEIYFLPRYIPIKPVINHPNTQYIIYEIPDNKF